MFSFKKRFNRMVIQKSRHSELITSTDLFKMKMNEDQTSYFFDSQGRKSAKDF